MSQDPRPEARPETTMLLGIYLLTYLSVLIRLLLRSPTEGLVGAETYWLMFAFFALGVSQAALRARWAAWTQIAMGIQCCVVIVLFLTRPSIDFYGLLCVGLAIVAGQDLPPRKDIVWIVVLCTTVTAGLVLAFGTRDFVSYVPIYIAGCLLVGLYGRATRKAEAARARSEKLRAELEEANVRLRAYAEQAERAAAAQERARLSRELHDAATQTVFSMNLTAEAARIARAEDPDRLPGLLDRLQELSRDALAELRTLVHELRPPSVSEEGLARALERHVSARGRRDGLRVTLSVHGEERGESGPREALLGAAVEALNNVAKHAGVSTATVELSFDATGAVLRVSDAGSGFDPAAPRPSESFGLLSMKERVESLGGTLSVRSAPGKGTEVEVRLPLKQGEAGA